MKLGFLLIVSGLISFTALYSNAEDQFDCQKVKNWPQESGVNNWWRDSECKDLISMGSNIKRFQAYREARNIPISTHEEKWLQLNTEIYAQVFQKSDELLRELHRDVQNSLKYNSQLCATPWECTTVFFGTTAEEMMCGSDCNKQNFRLSEEELLNLIGIVTQGMMTKSSSPKIVKLNEQVTIVRNAKIHDEKLSKEQLVLISKRASAASEMLKEYDKAFSAMVVIKQN